MSPSLRATRRRRSGAAATATGLAVAAAALLVPATGATAAAKAKPKAYTGTCEIAGLAKGYDPPLSVKPAPRTFSFSGTGTCKGGLVGQPTTTMTVVSTIKGRTNVDGCAYGITRAAPGVLRGTGSAAARAIRIPFTVDVLIDQKVTSGFIGDHGGAAVGTGDIVVDADVARGCQEGTLTQIRFSIKLRTVDPLVIDTPAQRRAAAKG